jgi:O-antigen ligase
MTGSRGGFVGFSVIVFMLLLTKTSAFRLSYKVVFVILILIIVSLKATTIDWERYQGITNYENDYNMTDEEGRMNVWKIAMRIMLSRPLTGVGIACFSAAIGTDREERGLSRTYWQAPHNMLVQIGTETGVIGLALFGLLSFRAFRIFGRVKKKARSEKLIKMSEMARLGFAGHFISGMFLSQAYSIYWAFYIVLSAVLQRFLNNETDTEQISQRLAV